VSPENLVELIRLVNEGIVSRLKAKDILEEMFETGKRAAEIVAEKGYKQLNSEEELSKIVDEVLNDNQKEVERYKKGEKKLFGFFMGKVMKKTGGNASPTVLQKILKKKLDGI
jgi:aspartyl-tRNA(Asn)/glutamyl-tRNA(Gln) amidotransferase subunit B